MSLLPEPLSDRPRREVALADRAQRRSELTVFKHALNAYADAERDRLDSQSTADAFQAALQAELDLLDYGLRRAGGSAAKVELVARKVEMLSSANNRRLGRRFGR